MEQTYLSTILQTLLHYREDKQTRRGGDRDRKRERKKEEKEKEKGEEKEQKIEIVKEEEVKT